MLTTQPPWFYLSTIECILAATIGLIVLACIALVAFELWTRWRYRR